MGHARKVLIILLNLMLDNHLAYTLIGIANRAMGRKIKTIFTLYPANEEYACRYVYPIIVKRMKWRPKLVGFMSQHGALGLIFGISAMERDFIRKENRRHLVEMVRRVNRIGKIVGAGRNTFAGILPGILVARKIVGESSEADNTARAVVRAIAKVKQGESLSSDVPLVIIGANGFVGRRIAERLTDYPGEIVPVDKGATRGGSTWSDHAGGKALILLNVSRTGVLREYLHLLRPGVVVVNEVYPEPSKAETEEIKTRGASLYHIVGIEGKAFPGFPAGYAGGIPCCASRLPDGCELNVLVRKL